MPVLRDISVTSGRRASSRYQSHTLDDDASGTSSGNGDGAANPAERIELPVQVKNFGTQTASAVTGTLSSDDPYVTILDASETFGDIAAGASAWSADDFDIQIAGGAPDGHTVYLDLDRRLRHGGLALADRGPGRRRPICTYDALTLYGFGTQIDPGRVG